MDSDRWIRLQNIVETALDLSGDDRTQYIDRACQTVDGKSDANLVSEATALIRAHESADAAGAIETPFDFTERGSALPFDSVGPWRILRELGSGGMGIVYLAGRADGSFEKSAALKVLHPGFGASFRARFELERSVLARLDHPGIARLLDGGLTSDGRPYVVMELAEGEPITAYAVARGLSLVDRLTLFVSACQAVDFAHRAAVVHRDLKPGHILVSDTEDGAAVKLLDFGVAKLLDDSVDPEITVLNASPATPQYAAPEQLSGGVITTATDVYALGAILYALITDCKPYDLTGLSAAGRERLIAQDVPPWPSDRVGDSSRRRELRGDLDQIVMKALAKDPLERYGSARELAEDIERHLTRRPIRARPPSSAYRLRRFVSRNRYAVAGAMLILVTAAAGLVGVLWQAGIAADERDRAERRFELAREQAQALLYDVDDLLEPIAGTTRVREALIDRSLTYLSRLSAEAQDDAPLRLDIATAYMRAGSLLGDPTSPNLGRLSDAVESYRSGVSILPSVNLLPRELQGRRLRIEALLMERLADAAAFSGEVDSAIVLLHDALRLHTQSAVLPETDNAIARRAVGVVHIKLGDYHGNSDFPNRDEPVTTAAHYDSALVIMHGLYSETDLETWRLVGVTHERRGSIRRIMNDLQGALADFEVSRDIRLRLAERTPLDYDTRRDVGVTHEKLAAIHRENGQMDAALGEIRQALNIYEGIARTDPENVQSWQTLAVGHLHTGDIITSADRHQAVAHYEEGLRVLREHADTTNPRTRRLVEILSSRL